ncbi:winged helix-turn-helix domain-containing protein [Paenibacillus graminis]|nr:helix-turn-helix domain-containing protein [Paenibacillus graminis]
MKNVHSLSHGAIRINQGNRSVSFFEDQEIELSKNEYRVFQFLFDNRNRVISTEELIYSLWDGLTSEANVYMTMQKLRNKIEKKPNAPELLLTKKGEGYVLICH